MFYYLYGMLTELNADHAVIECGGVGYIAYISLTTHARLMREHTLLPDGTCDGKMQKLYTHYSVKEDAEELYGFYDTEERDVFRLLITVSGIGPKCALSVLSALSPAELCSACMNDDARSISKANGIGLKTAQKVILELKDKLAKTVSPFETDVSEKSSEKLSDIADDAVTALTVLGYTKSEAIKAVKASNGGTVEELIRSALKKLMK